MPNVTTQYRMFVPRRRRIGGGGTAIDLVPPSVNFVTGNATAPAPDTIEVHYPNATADAGEANFAFWSVQGSSDGEYTDRPTSPGHPITVHTGGDPVTMTAWYIYAGSGVGPPGPPELETDAFLVDENTFIDPTPIQSVSPAAAWDHSDDSEFVLTADESVDVLALETVTNPSEHFEHWYTLEGGATPAGHTLQVPRNDNGIAIATYRIPPSVPPPKFGGRPVEGEVGIVVGGTPVDGDGGIIIGGKFHPIPPWSPFLSAFAVYDAAQGLPRGARTVVQLEALQSIVHQANVMAKHVEVAAASHGG